jgi:hypothetical protein
MASQVTLKALGLNYSPNNLALPEGSLVVADDVIVRRDNVLESRRGFREYSEPFGAGVDRSKQLISYKDRILNHYNDILQYDTGVLDNDGKAIFDSFNGTYNEVQTGLRIKSIESNKNLYFTTDKGIKKISARTAADFTTASGFIDDAGGIKATDFTATLNITQGQTAGFLPVDSAVAYRILWGYRDLNENLILGAPSDSISVYNYLSNIVSLDLNTFLIALDNCVQNTSTYYSVLHNSTSYGSETFGSSETFSDKFKVNITDDATVYAANVNSTAEYIDKFATLGDNTATYTFTVTALTTVTPAGTIYNDALSGNTFTVTANAGLGATSLVCTGTGDPAAGISGSTNLTRSNTSPAGGQSPVIPYSSYVKTLPNNKPLQVNTAKTYTFTISSSILSISTAAPATVTAPRITTTTPHGLVTGDTVYFSGLTTTGVNIDNSSYAVTVLSPTLFSITVAGPGITGVTLTANSKISTASSAIVAGDVYRQAIPIVSVSNTGTPATITTGIPHGLITGDSTTISGTTTTNAINGTHTVTVTSPTTFTIPVNVTVPTNPLGVALGGNIFTAQAASIGASTFVCVGSGNPASYITAGLIPLTLIRVSGTGLSTVRYVSYAVSNAGFSSSAGIASVDFTGDPSTVFSAGDLIEVKNAVDANNDSYSFTVNKKYTFTIPASNVFTFSSFTSNGNTFTAIPLTTILSYTFAGTSGPSGTTGANTAINDVYGYTDPNTGYTFRYTVTTAAIALVANGFGQITTGAGVLYKISGAAASPAFLNFTSVTAPTSATLICLGTGLPTAPGAATTGTLSPSSGVGTSYNFTGYTVADPVVPTGSVYTNNFQRFSVTGYNNLTTVTANGTGVPNSASSNPILSLFTGNGESVLQYSAFTQGTSSYTSFNNTSTNKYWTITSVDSVNKKILFNIPTTSTIIGGSAGASVDILSYNYRNIVETGDVLYSTPLSELVVSTPATSEQLRIIQNTISRLATRLKNEKSGYISSALKTAYVSNFSTTSYANVSLDITVPQNISSTDYFLQVYRTRNFTATGVNILGVDVTPDDEMRLVYEAFPIGTLTPLPTSFSFIDEYPEALRDNNVNLYTNPVTGEGISQANDVPPVAKDINRFKNVVFYANTKTRHRLNPFQLVGTSNINTGDSITVSDGTNTNIYEFVEGIQQVSRIVFNPATLPSNLIGAGPSFTGKYFEINSAEDETEYYVWYRVDNVGTDPAVAGKTGIRIDLLSTDTATIIRNKTLNTINAFSLDFTAQNSPVPDDVYGLDITNVNFGITTDAIDGNIGAGFVTISTPVQGNGEDSTASPPKVLLSKVSTSITAAQAIDETARSLVRIINKTASSTITAYYISSSTSLPGQINLESELINDIPFYVQASTVDVGASFNPNIEPYNPDNNTIQRISGGTQVQFTTSTPHGLNDGDNIFISLATVAITTPPPVNLYLNGIYSVTSTTSNTFTINVTTVPFNTAAYDFAWSRLSNVSVSNNETKPNRVYYSKLSQPEAVPLLNYFDIGASDKEILRIFPLRDSLFVFKEDGLYRISGEVAPFVVGLFDSSCVLIAPDSVSVANNIIYGWTTKGISNITEAGVTEVSRPIDTAILQLASTNYTNFSTATWGLGYDSDNSYTVYACEDPEDEIATIGFRFSNLTNTWTNFKRSQTCGIIRALDDRIYTGSGTINVIDQERKNFDRTDYADKDFDLNVGNGFLNSNQIQVSSAQNIAVGDVLTQDQSLTVYKFNAFLDKLDLDATVGEYGYTASPTGSTTITITTTQYGTIFPPISHNLNTGDWINVDSSNSNPSIDGVYQITVTGLDTFTIQIPYPLITLPTGTGNKITRNYSKTFEAVTGDNLRTKLVQLAAYLDTDPSLTPPVSPAGLTYTNIIANKSGSIASVNVANPGVINTSSAHQILDDRIVSISGTLGPVLPDIVDTYQVNVTGSFPSNFGSTSFQIPVNITTPSSGSTSLNYDTASNELDIRDIAACFNGIVNLLNESGSGTTFKNYPTISTTTQFEAIVTSVNKTLNLVTLNLPIQLVVGDIKIYKSIPCNVIYAPITFGDPLQLKQVYESTLMFANKAFYKVVAGFSSDLKPDFTYVEFEGQGNGNFGNYSNPGFGYGFFGGSSNAAPCRTLVPRQNQRCRFINMRFGHSTAREIWSLYGVTLTFNPTQSTRAYR